MKTTVLESFLKKIVAFQHETLLKKEFRTVFSCKLKIVIF